MPCAPHGGLVDAQDDRRTSGETVSVANHHAGIEDDGIDTRFGRCVQHARRIFDPRNGADLHAVVECQAQHAARCGVEHARQSPRFTSL